MLPSDKLTGVRAKIQRAREHIADLEREIKSFLHADPYQVVFKNNLDGTQMALVERADDVPVKVHLIAGDAIQTLRTSLDQLAFQLFLAAGTGGQGRDIYFPIFDSAARYIAKSPRKVAGMDQAAINAIDATEPYKGGNGHQLWILHKLNNADKHRLLIASGLAYSSVITSTPAGFASGYRQPTSFKPDLLPVNRHCPLKTGNVLHVTPIGIKVDKDAQFTFDVAFCEPGVVEGEPVVETIKQFADLVGNIVTRLASLL